MSIKLTLPAHETQQLHSVAAGCRPGRRQHRARRRHGPDFTFETGLAAHKGGVDGSLLLSIGFTHTFKRRIKALDNLF